MKMNVRSRYMQSDEYEYQTRLERINLDKSRHDDVITGNGFIISAPKAIKDDIKDPNGIFSTKYGPGLQDANAFGNRYRCKCGYRTQRFRRGETCPICGTKVEFRDDNFELFGYIVLKDPYHLIHPNMFVVLKFFIGEKEFMDIINPIDRKDEDGHDININPPKDQPFYGIGMMDFYNRFDEIMEYYKAKKPTKIEYYTDIMKNRDLIFTQSVPVFTTQLRPFRVENGVFHYEGTNEIYNILANIGANVNKDDIKMQKKKKPKNQLLFDMQKKFQELYDELTKILSGKKGAVRQLFGGRYNFTARSVIVPGPELRIDEVQLSYPCLCELLQQRIINILHKSYNMKYNDAYKLLHESMHKENPMIREIIEAILRSYPRGLPILINRNPTISLGGIIQMYCTSISVGYTMKIPLEILEGLAADFDGDTLNILLIINKEFQTAAENVFNPRNSMYISKNDGMFNPSYNHKRDTLINANTLVQLSRSNYSPEDLEKLRKIVKSAS